MKKIFATILGLAAVLNLSAQTWPYTLDYTYPANHEYGTYNLHRSANSVVFKMNVRDYDTGEPVPNVKVNINMKDYTGTRRLLFFTISNIWDGVGYYGKYFTSDGIFTPINNDGVELSGQAFGYVNPDVQTIDCDPFTVGYNYVTNVAEASDRIRNGIRGENIAFTTVRLGNNARFNDTRLASNWRSEGASVEYDVFVKCTNAEHQVLFDTREIRDASKFTPITVATDGTITLPTEVPVHKTSRSKVFDHWEYNGKVFDPTTYKIKHNIGLVPVWKTDPSLGSTGKVKVVARMWDHAAYWENPKQMLTYGENIVNGVKGSLKAADYLSNAGWTDIPIEGLEFVIKSYADKGGVVYDKDKIPLGRPYTADWIDLASSRVKTDAKGEATYEISAEQMSYLTAGFRIDMDPDPNCIAKYDRGLGFGVENTSFNWDIVLKGDYGFVAGLVGVRYVLEGERHNNVGDIHISSFNDNDVVVLTQDNIDNGFECTFYCYVTPSCIVNFDLNGGTLNGSSTVPSQKFDVPNSIGGFNRLEYKATSPEGNYVKDTLVFVGWHELRKMADGTIVTDPVPFDFSRPITYSMNLKAEWDKKSFVVRFAPENWDGTTDTVGPLYEKDLHVKDGDLDTYDSALPTKKIEGEAPYEFIGWDVYQQGETADKTFLGNSYEYLGFVPQNGTGGMVTLTNPLNDNKYYQSPIYVKNNQVYIAKFAQKSGLKIEKEGLGLGDSAIFTISAEGQPTRQIVLTGDGTSTKISKMAIVPAGNWTVTEETSWSWSYSTATATQTVSIESGKTATVTFSNTAKPTTPAHDESSVNNVFSK